MILNLFLGFLKVGCFSFGGAYAAIPLIRDTVLSYGWLNDELLTYMIAVSESTPGPIMVNLATYIGAVSYTHLIFLIFLLRHFCRSILYTDGSGEMLQRK